MLRCTTGSCNRHVTMIILELFKYMKGEYCSGADLDL